MQEIVLDAWKFLSFVSYWLELPSDRRPAFLVAESDGDEVHVFPGHAGAETPLEDLVRAVEHTPRIRLTVDQPAARGRIDLAKNTYGIEIGFPDVPWLEGTRPLWIDMYYQSGGYLEGNGGPPYARYPIIRVDSPERENNVVSIALENSQVGVVVAAEASGEPVPPADGSSSGLYTDTAGRNFWSR